MNEYKRFLSKIKKNKKGCWIWTDSLTKGYGNFSAYGKPISAHRFSYQYHIGKIPKGMTVDHMCNTPACVNHKHLNLATLRDNVLRSNGITAMNSRKTQCSNGHEFNEKNTYFSKRLGPNGIKYERHCKICMYSAKKAWETKNRKHYLMKQREYSKNFRKRQVIKNYDPNS